MSQRILLSRFEHPPEWMGECGGDEAVARRGIQPWFRAVVVAGLAVAILALGPGALHAQIAVGPEVRYEYGLALMLNRNPGAVDWCACSGDGTSFNHTLWAGVTLRGLFSGPFDVAEHIAIGYATGRFTSDAYDDTSATGRSNRFLVDGTAVSVSEDLLMLWHVSPRVTAEIGPSVTYRIGGTFTQRERILVPSNGIFTETGTAERTVRSGDVLAGARLQVTALAGASYSMPISASWALFPSLHVRVNPDALRLGVGAGSISIIAGITLLASVPQEGPAIPPRPPEPPAPVAPAPFTASVVISAEDPAGGNRRVFTVRRRNMRHRQRATLPPVILFDRNTAALPDWYAQLDRAATRAFTDDSLARLDPFALVSQTLNVVGLRMHTDPAASITLSGRRTPREPASLARARAAAVRAYLAAAWGIDTARLVVASAALQGHASEAGNTFAGVGLSSASPGLLAPVETEWDEQEIDAPQIGLKPGFAGGAGMRSWSITVRRNGREITHYSSDGAGGSDELNLGLGDDREAGLARHAPLVAELIAEDSSGALAAARDSLPIEMDTVATADARRWWTYGMVIDGVNADAMLREIEAATGSGDRVVIQFTAEDEAARMQAEQLRARLGARGASVRVESVPTDRSAVPMLVVNVESGGR